MDNQKPPEENSAETPSSPTPVEIIKPVNVTSTEPATAKQLEDVEEKASAFERSTLRWAKAAVIMSALAALFVCLQWYEMHTGGKDTHDLAVAAGNQATWTQRLADSAKTQSDRTQTLADRMKDQADRTKDVADRTKNLADQAIIQSKAAERSAGTARDALQIGNRPWIKISHRIVEPLNFSFVGASGPAATMRVEDTMENVGQTVAINVLAWEDIIPNDYETVRATNVTIPSVKSAVGRQDDWCGTNRNSE
jgi:hypothetical protein